MTTPSSSPEISIVIPVYKAESCLDELYRRICNSLGSIAGGFELILVEDSGPDRSWQKICEIADRDPRVLGFQLSRNFGQHNAITAGLDQVRGRWVVVMDCDLQDRPEEIPNLYGKAKEGFDGVLARRVSRQDRQAKKASSYLFHKLFNFLSGMKYDWAVGNFRIVRAELIHDLNSQMREQVRGFASAMHWAGYKTASIDVEHAERFAGRSSYSLSKLLKFASQLIVSYSNKPLHLSIYFGFSISFLSFVLGCYFLFRYYVQGSVVPGWYSLIISNFFLGGVILVSVGILGVYMGKVFDEGKRRPLYLIRERTEQNRK